MCDYLDLIKIKTVVAIPTIASKQLTVAMLGSSGIVAQFTNNQIGSKLLAMGVLPGNKIEVVREAPFGGGVIVKVDNNFLALRKQEAACILLK